MFPIPHGQVPAQLDAWGTVADLGSEILEGDALAFGKLNYGTPDAPVSAGFFAVTQGKFRMTYPFDEHAVVVAGECVLLNENTGESTRYGVGDAWFVQKGTPVVWTILTPRFAKHYMAVA